MFVSGETRHYNNLMILLSSSLLPALRSFFQPEIPAYPVGLHVINTKHGRLYADRWPNPRAVLAESAGNYTLTGDPEVLMPDELRPLVRGFVSAPEEFDPLLRAAFPELGLWARVVYELCDAPGFTIPEGVVVRRMVAEDSLRLAHVSPDLAWVGKTWGGIAGLAASGRAWGAFVGKRLVSIACTFFQGDHYEDIGVVTEADFRRQGLSVACAGRLCEDILARGCRPSWNTSPDNFASIRVAEKLGFEWLRGDRLYIIGVTVPTS
jgi:GNAT superfamily N-acetyltransferase